jgi:hypothetical protein
MMILFGLDFNLKWFVCDPAEILSAGRTYACWQTITELYRCRWPVELFFKWMKRNLRIKQLYINSENVVKTQIWIAVSIYVLVDIVKKRLNPESQSPRKTTDPKISTVDNNTINSSQFIQWFVEHYL